MKSVIKNHYNKSVLTSQVVGILAFIVISFIHDGLDINRNIESYLIPILFGFIVGTIFGLMKSIIYAKNIREQQTFINIIETLAMSLDERDKYTHGHSRRVTNLALALGDHIGLNINNYSILRLGSILHDIGKIGVPDSILLKPGKLTGEEFEIIKKHPEQGVHILQPLKHDYKVLQIIPIIRHHHERYDGNGYPDGLSGENIPLLARVVAIADSYDAMTSDRPYRKGMSKEKALAEIEKGSHTQYDPHLAMKFIFMMKQYGKSKCPSQATCKIFDRIENNELSVAYRAQFCHGLYESCARYKIKNKKERPDHLMPDGSLLKLDKKIVTGND